MTNNNLEEYNDPILYDSENESYKDDVQFLLKRAEAVDGPIIDLACGTGRASIPLAHQGHVVIGVDIHKGMLEQAKRKTKNSKLPIRWEEQDCTKLELGVKSPFISMVGNSFQHFLTNEEQDQVLARIYQHLDEDGMFIFGIRFPSREELLQPETEEFWKSYQDEETGTNVNVSTISTYDDLAQVQSYITIRRFLDDNGSVVDEKRSRINLRYVFPQEMVRLLERNGLEIVEVYKDWNGNSLTKDSTQMIYICRKIYKEMV